ncbi:hypothetical protein KKC62_01365 [Patescibacteria group bacterium]|nr:hypothetical protein [Patescibacteria group bacterium]MBU1952847.1 hypothetical protein [Patescibacteria group bacterium]
MKKLKKIILRIFSLLLLLAFSAILVLYSISYLIQWNDDRVSNKGAEVVNVEVIRKDNVLIGQITNKDDVSSKNLEVGLDNEAPINVKEDGTFRIEDINKGNKHLFYINGSLSKKIGWANVSAKNNKTTAFIVKRPLVDFTFGADTYNDKSLYSAINHWSLDRSELFYINSTIVANMLSTFSARAAYKIDKAFFGRSTPFVELTGFNQKYFTHLDDHVEDNPEEEYTLNDIYGYTYDKAGVLWMITPIDTVEFANQFRNLYGSGAMRCEGFALWDVAMLRILGYGVDEVIVGSFRGSVGHVAVIVNTSLGANYLLSNQYLFDKGGEAAPGTSRLYGDLKQAENFVVEDTGIDTFANDFYNVFTPEAIVNNMPVETLKDYYDVFSEMIGRQVPLVEKEEDYNKKIKDEPTISIEDYLKQYTQSTSNPYPEIDTSIYLNGNWVTYHNTLQKEIWELASLYPKNSPYVLAKYNNRSLFVSRPELYAQVSLKGNKVIDLAKTVRSPNAILAWISKNVNMPVYTENTQIMLADEPIVFSAGRPQDKAMLAFTLLKLNNYEAEIVIAEDTSYVLFKEGGKVKVWDMATLSETGIIADRVHIVFNESKTYYPNANRFDEMPINFVELTKK